MLDTGAVVAFLACLVSIVGIIVQLGGFLYNKEVAKKYGDLAGVEAIKKYEEETRKKQNKAARALIGLEIDANLILLRDFWHRANEIEDGELSAEERQRRLSYQLINISLPQWSTMALESQMSILTMALDEEEIKQIYFLLSQFDIIRYIYNKISDLQSSRPRGMKSTQEPLEVHFANIDQTMFQKRLIKLREEFEQAIKELLNRENPLQY